MEAAVSNLVAFVGAIGASALLGFTKKYTGALDGKIGAVIKPVQPILVTVGAYALPLLGNALGLLEPINATEFMAAPTAGIITVAAREALARLQRSRQ